jgi:hypothetical protein
LGILNSNVAKMAVILASCDLCGCLWPCAYHVGAGLPVCARFFLVGVSACFAGWLALFLVLFVLLGGPFAWAVGSHPLPACFNLWGGSFGVFYLRDL